MPRACRLPPGLLTLALAGCTAGGGPDAGEAAGEDAAERVVDAVVEFRIGLADGDPAYLFGTIDGIAVGPDGRVYVADGRSNAIRIYGADGRFVSQFGRSGDGPGDFYNPCCLAFDDGGRLWVWNNGDLARQIRYDAFDVSGRRPVHQLRIAGAGIGLLWPVRRVLFDRDGNILHPTFFTEPATPAAGAERRTRSARLHLDSTGVELRRVLLPYVSRDSLGGLPPPRTAGGVSLARPGPLVTMQLRAHSPLGGFVDAVNVRYEVNWYDDDGAPVRVTRRAVAGPPLTGAERDEAATVLRQMREIAGQRGVPPLDLTMPERHPPLERLVFDDAGRLWVERRTAAADDFALADVYLPDGSYRQTVRWPRDVILYHGAVDGHVIYGVSLDELGVPRLVKLRVPPITD